MRVPRENITERVWCKGFFRFHACRDNVIEASEGGNDRPLATPWLMVNVDNIRLSELDDSHPETVEAVYNWLYDYGRRRARNLSSSEIHDVIQAVFLIVAKMAPEKKDEVQKPVHYLAIVYRHVMADLWRNQLNERLENTDALDVTDSGETARHYYADIYVWEIMNRLDNDIERKILKMRIFHYTHKEIARLLEMSEDAVRQKSVRLVKKMKEILLKEYPELGHGPHRPE